MLVLSGFGSVSQGTFCNSTHAPQLQSRDLWWCGGHILATFVPDPVEPAAPSTSSEMILLLPRESAELEIKHGILPSTTGNFMARWYFGSGVHQATCTHMFRHIGHILTEGYSYEHLHAPPCLGPSSRAAISFLLNKLCPRPVASSLTLKMPVLRGT